MLLVKLIAGLAGLYVVLAALMALAQDWLLFPRWAMVGGAPALSAAAERLTVTAPGGERLAGVLMPAAAGAEGAPLVLGFGGNAWDAEALALYLHTILPGHAVAAFHFRGYGPSEGRPSARALREDALAIHDALAEAHAPDGIVAVGLSLGSGPAAHLASRRDLAGIVLVTPFDSLRALAREHYPWAPVGLLLRHRMDVAEAVAATSAPVALIAAERDTIVPARRTASLRGAARHLVLDRVVAGAGHNDLYDTAGFREAMAEALARIETAGAAVPAP
jgi:uncharacterized protein